MEEGGTKAGDGEAEATALCMGKLKGSAELLVVEAARGSFESMLKKATCLFASDIEVSNHE